MPANQISELRRRCSRTFERRFWSQAWEKLRESFGHKWTLTLTFVTKTRHHDNSTETRQLIRGEQQDRAEPVSGPADQTPWKRQPPAQPSPSTKAAKAVTIGGSLMFSGTLSGREDVYVDGRVDGIIQLQDGDLTVSPSGQVNADITAGNVTVFGRVTGNVFPAERMEIRKNGSLLGDVKAARIIVEDGAVLQGRVDVMKRGTDSGAAPKTRPLIIQQDSRAGD
jgi:cytoskeletal protein CcmA (bactofilin family)